MLKKQISLGFKNFHPFTNYKPLTSVFKNNYINYYVNSLVKKNDNKKFYMLSSMNFGAKKKITSEPKPTATTTKKIVKSAVKAKIEDEDIEVAKPKVKSVKVKTKMVKQKDIETVEDNEDIVEVIPKKRLKTQKVQDKDEENDQNAEETVDDSLVVNSQLAKMFNNNDPLVFDESMANNFKFKHLCSVFQLIESHTSRNKKQEVFSFFLKMLVNPQYSNLELLGKIIKISIPYLTFIQNKDSDIDLSNQENTKIQYTFDSILKKYIKDSFKLSDKAIQQYYLINGDISQIIYDNFKEKTTKVKFENYLTIDEIIQAKLDIINEIGTGSEITKIEIVKNLFKKCTCKEEALYLSRIFLNKLRIGLGDKGIIQCIEDLSTNPTSLGKENEYFIKCMEYLKDEVFKFNFSEVLLDSDFKVGKLFHVCLAKPSDTYETFLNNVCSKYLKVLVETKYDGERTQLHYSRKDNLLTIGSRSLESQNSLYSSLCSKLKEQLDEIPELENVVLDGEIVLYDTQVKGFANFQELRKKEYPSHMLHFVVAFDILMYNNHKVYKLDLDQRKEILINKFMNKTENLLVEAGKIIELKEEEKANTQFKDEFLFAKQMNCEGLIVKQLGEKTFYHFNKRHWIKLKNLGDNSVDTLDLIPIAATFGKGNKQNLFSSFLMAYYSKKSGQYISLCRLGTGFSIDDLKMFYTEFSKKTIAQPLENYVLPIKSRPNIFFKPSEVWEVGFDSFTQSTSYPALQGLIDDFNVVGVSLRFPRFIRRRLDKTAADCTNTESLYDIYLKSYKNEKYKAFPNFNESVIDEEDEEIEEQAQTDNNTNLILDESIDNTEVDTTVKKIKNNKNDIEKEQYENEILENDNGEMKDFGTGSVTKKVKKNIKSKN